ncbi:MAG: ABC transporter ATP-binding protein [Candidatus Pseudothioglobus sp.]|jgi:multiple sugar transport system ATP-binding protein
MADIIIRNLTKKYGSETALNNVSLEIKSGEFMVLLGPSGCGKTTLLRCLAGLETPDQGEIIIGDKVVFSTADNIMSPPGERNLGMVFQSYALWPHMTVRDNIKFGLDVLNTPKNVSNDTLDRVLKSLGMKEFENRYPSELSGGQQQRVALARLLATKPPVFLMDEPLSNLDARLRMDMRVELKKFQSESEATTVYVTHDQTEAMTMSTRVVVMKNGEIQQVASPGNLYRHPSNTFVADFIGMPRINLINLTKEHKDGSIFINKDVQIDVGWVPASNEIVLGAHPEDLVVSKKEIPSSEKYSVTAVLPNGPETILQLTRGKTAVIARVAHDSTFNVDESVYVNFSVSSLNIYDSKNGAIIEPSHN